VDGMVYLRAGVAFSRRLPLWVTQICELCFFLGDVDEITRDAIGVLGLILGHGILAQGRYQALSMPTLPLCVLYVQGERAPAER